MIVAKEKVVNGSYNFCKRRVLNTYGTGLIYPDGVRFIIWESWESWEK